MARTPELLWSLPLEGDELAGLLVGDHGDLAVSTSQERTEPRAGGFDPMESTARGGSGGMVHSNLYAHRSYCIDARGHPRWQHSDLRIACAIPEGWAALTDRHDLVLIDQAGVATQRRRLRGDTWRICGWKAGEPVVTSDPDATWVDPYVYSARDGQLQYCNQTGRERGTIDLARTPFDDECRRDPPPPGLPDGFLFPRRLRLIFDRERGNLLATHRRHMAWVASITLDGELSWVRLVDHACCNSACIVGEHIVHTSSCGEQVTVLNGDGRVLARRHLPSVQDAVADGRGGLCVRTLNGLCGFDEGLEPTWSLTTHSIPHVAARDGVLYAVTGRPGALGLAAYAVV